MKKFRFAITTAVVTFAAALAAFLLVKDLGPTAWEDGMREYYGLPAIER